MTIDTELSYTSNTFFHNFFQVMQTIGDVLTLEETLVIME